MNQIKTYVTIMQESLERKGRYLSEILELTRKQEQLAKEKKFNEDAFGEIIDKKEVLIHNINEIDKGFTSVYDRVRTEVLDHQDVYREELLAMQASIRLCVDLGMQIEALEERNRKTLSQAFAKGFRGIKQAKQSKQAASRYYQNMANGMVNDSMLYDRKK